MHDLAHPGLTNDFLNRSGDPLSQLHGGGGGVNERHHVATFFSTSEEEGNCVFSNLSEAECLEVRAREVAQKPLDSTTECFCCMYCHT